MKQLLILSTALILAGCISPYKEMSGKYIKSAQVEIRSSFGTN